jgi:hypothetical protein
MSDRPAAPTVGSHRRTGRFWLLVAVFVIVLASLALYWTGRHGFEVNGVPFRVWVAQHPDFEIQDPLAAVGTDAIPHLVRILREPGESPRAYRMKVRIWKYLPSRFRSAFQQLYPVPQWQLKRTALFGLRFLGPEAKAALPEVLRIGQLETNRMVEATALTAALAIAPESSETFRLWRQEWERTNYTRRDLAIYLHSARYPFPPAVPLLLDQAKRTANPVTFLEAFEFFGEAAQPAVPEMVQMLTNRPYRGNMMRLLKRLGPVASEAVPALAALLDERDPAITECALEVLKSIGPEARSALPQIEPLLTNRDFTVRMVAASIVGRIEGRLETALPVLLQGLDRPPTIGGVHMTINVGQMEGGIEIGAPEAAAVLLGECGPPASGALPALERKLQDRSEWVRLASGGSADQQRKLYQCSSVSSIHYPSHDQTRLFSPTRTC